MLLVFRILTGCDCVAPASPDKLERLGISISHARRREVRGLG
jgi:hypothetical protein